MFLVFFLAFFGIFLYAEIEKRITIKGDTMKKLLLPLFLAIALVCAMLPLSSTAAPAADARLLDGATLLALGDSLTAMGSWSQTVAEELNMIGVNSGVGGNTSADALARFERDVVKKNPDFVLIGLGTNDFIREGQGNTSPRVSVEQFRANIQTMIDGVKALNAVPILITAPYVRDDAYPPISNYEDVGGMNPALDIYIEAVRQLSKDNDIGLVDIHKICDDYPLEEFLISDGVHLSATGNRVYADAIEEYLTANFRSDPNAPRVERPTAPDAEEGYWTKNFASFKAEDWVVIKEGTVVITEGDGTISFANTNGLWPEVHYSPSIDKTIAVPVKNSYLTIDFTTEAATNLVLYLNGATPTVAYDRDNIDLIPLITAADPSLKTEEVGDLSANQTVRCTLRLEDFIPRRMISEDGTVLLSGLKVYVVGAAGKKITFRELSVTNPDPSTLPQEPVYENVVSLLPTEQAQISPNQGIADYTINENGSLTLSRAAEDTLFWPSISIAVSKEVDLDDSPYLHMDFTCEGGCANGVLYYTADGGAEQSVQLSQLRNGTVNDFTSDQHLYVNLSEALNLTGKITVTRVQLSVYGAPGDALTWYNLAMAKLVKEARPAPEVSEPSDVSEDATSESSAESSGESGEETAFPTVAIIGIIVVAAAAVCVILLRKNKHISIHRDKEE